MVTTISRFEWSCTDQLVLKLLSLLQEASPSKVATYSRMIARNLQIVHYCIIKDLLHIFNLLNPLRELLLVHSERVEDATVAIFN